MIWLINKIADHITKISKPLQQNNSETITNKHDEEIHIYIYIYIYVYIYIYITKTENYWWSKIKREMYKGK